MPIETLLNNEGKGVLTKELYRLFVSNGCEPKCHICNAKIKVGDRLHLKPFFAKVSEPEVDEGFVIPPSVDRQSKTTSSIDVMICVKCSDSNRKLPQAEANNLLEVAHEHGLVSFNPEQSPHHGRIGPPAYSYSRPGYRSRGGGAMIVRTSQGIKIIGSDT